jgi:hypothetical protein
MYNLIKEYGLENELVEINTELITDLQLKTNNYHEAMKNINNISDDEKIIMICHELCMNL